jgi:hypothetical protein
MAVVSQRRVMAALSPGKENCTHSTDGYLVPRAGTYGLRRFRHYRDSIPGPSSPLRVATPTALSRPLTF